MLHIKTKNKNNMPFHQICIPQKRSWITYSESFSTKKNDNHKNKCWENNWVLEHTKAVSAKWI